MKISSETIKELDENKELENIKKIEAALFLSARYLTLQDLVLLTDINPLMLKESMDKLITKYNRDDSAIEIISKENMWKMDVGQEYVSMVNKLATGSSEFTKAEQETLAMIAYKQPVKQSVIIKIRGNKAYEHIKHFIDIGLVQSKKMGHTKELRLSDDFYDYFHLQNKEDVLDGPEEPEQNEEGEPDKKEAEQSKQSEEIKQNKPIENSENPPESNENNKKEEEEVNEEKD